MVSNFFIIKKSLLSITQDKIEYARSQLDLIQRQLQNNAENVHLQYSEEMAEG